MDERDTNEGGGAGAIRPGETTKRTDFARLIGVRLGLTITEVGNRISEVFRKLSEVGGSRRRSILEGALDELDEVADTLDDAKALMREQIKIAYLEKEGTE